MTYKSPLNIILVFFALLAFTACEETVVLDLDFESRLVVNSFFDSNSSWAVEVSKSANILDDNSNIELVKNARVIIYDEKNVEQYELFHQENGVYGNQNFSPVSTHGYNIKVEFGAMVATAYSYVPEKSILKINNFSVVQEDKNKGIEVDFQIEDKSNIEAYFIWEIVNLEDDEDDQSLSNGDKLSDALINNLQSSIVAPETTSREIIGVGVFGDGTYSTVYNTLKGRKGGRSSSDPKIDSNGDESKVDESTVGLDYYDSIVFYDPYEGDGDPIDQGDVIKNNPTFELRVVSISKELFDYYSSVEVSRSVGNDTENTQIPIYSNIENGLGIFAGFNESIIRF
ncbi:MAG: hypothetical protein ACJATI_001126 [Halioglobus sp.]|jgi:hypothetical protein